MNANSQPSPNLDKVSSALEAVARRMVALWLPPHPRKRREVTLEATELYRFDQPGKIQEIRCARGLLWVTQSGNGQDYLLRPGETFEPRGSGLVIAEALSGSAIMNYE